jgi:hypothetical protein
MKKIFVLLLLCTFPSSLLAQGSVSAQREAIKKFDFLVGQWKGSGWNEQAPGQRHTFSINETVQSKLGGLVLLIEGIGKAKMPGDEEGPVMHQALATLSYDEQARRYRFISYTAEGRFGDNEARLIEGGLEWGFQIPQGGRIRFTIKLTPQGEWFEIGEFSQDGKTWRRFLEMTLRRVN